MNEPAGGSERVTSETGKSVADPREAEPIEGNATDADDVKVGTFESDETGTDGVNVDLTVAVDCSLDCFGQVLLEYRLRMEWFALCTTGFVTELLYQKSILLPLHFVPEKEHDLSH